MGNSICMLFLIMLLPLNILAQKSKKWQKGEGVIKEIERKRSGRNVKEIATVEFETKERKEITTYIELFRIPILGSMKSVGDTITIYYEKENPAIAKTNSGKFISQYGMYILIVVGIISSGKTLLNMRKHNSRRKA